jgi:Protein of unknown function (DUF1549)/Protein of unknown function (DUF1553)/Bacterial Ig-like domain (group 2)
MQRSLLLGFASGWALLLVSYCSVTNAADVPARPAAPGLGDPGALQKIVVQVGRTDNAAFVLAGRDAAQQLVVTGEYASGQTRDLSRNVKYQAQPENIVQVDATGYVTPVAEGEATLTLSGENNLQTSIKVQVVHFNQDTAVNFPNQVVPIFTKHGCNGGGCHGKSGGQNGFRLSLLGFEPSEDYEWLVKEARGRRIFPGSPEQSLLLTKATAKLPHGGGQRIEPDSAPYKLLRKWIEQGMPYGKETDPHVVAIEVFPKERLMERETKQQLVVIAKYSDGSTEDVTRTTSFDSNDGEMAEASVTGLITTGKLTGSVAVMARYQGNVDVFRATVPLGVKIESLPPTKNTVDEFVFSKLKSLGLPASQVCDDATFLRRVSVDLAGRLPTLVEAEQFLADQDPNKREKVVDRLLSSGDHADYFANKWSAILRNKRRQENEKTATYSFHSWIRESIYNNKPYDQFVREVLTATGQPGDNPAVGWYRELKDMTAQVEDTAQLFLGLRLQCAKCHHHPFERWSQEDYYGFAAFYSRVGRKKGDAGQGSERIYHQRGVASANNPKTKKDVKPTGLGSPAVEISADADPRHAMLDWMVQADNPFFAKSLVNRYWKHFFGRGLVDPEDDMRVTNPATNPQLLEALAKEFIDHKFDQRHILATICKSSTYQLAADANDWNQDDKQNFSRFYPRRLNAEVLLDAIDQVTGTTTNFNGVPVGTRATQLPDNGFNSYFLTVFGRPDSSSACECERSSDANLAQSLHLLNSNEIQSKLTNGAGNANRLATDKARSHAEKLRELYLLAFAREPRPEELTVAMKHVEKSGDDPRRAYEDIVWALINTKEFLFTH